MLTRLFNPPFLGEFSAIDPGTVVNGADEGSLAPHQLCAKISRPSLSGGGPPHQVPLRYFKALGTGEVGDKVRQLDEAHAAVTEVGLKIPPGNVITEDRLIPILRRLGLGNSLAEADQHPDASAIIRAAEINSDDALWLIKAMEGIPRDQPIVVRSSAVGDAEGSGTYESLFIPGNFPALGQAVFQVLASYFTKDARAFRQLCGAQHGLGILVMPAIVQKLPTVISNSNPITEGSPVWAPILSGSGVTSNRDGEPETWVVPGLGGGVNGGYPERLTLSLLDKHRGDFFYYLLCERVELFKGAGQKRISSLLRSDVIVKYIVGPKRDYSAMGLTDSQREGVLTAASHRIILADDLLKQIPLIDFLNALQTLEQRLGYRAYVEWALRFEDDQSRFYIVQVARAELSPVMIDFAAIPHAILSGHSVYGAAKDQVCPAIVYYEGGDLNALYRFDQEHPQGYVLLYPASLKSRRDFRPSDVLPISAVRNAQAIIEVPNVTHAATPISHWRGQIEKSGKVFAVLADHTLLPPQIRAAMTQYADNITTISLEQPVIVNASARQNRLVVSLPLK